MFAHSRRKDGAVSPHHSLTSQLRGLPKLPFRHSNRLSECSRSELFIGDQLNATAFEGLSRLGRGQ